MKVSVDLYKYRQDNSTRWSKTAEKGVTPGIYTEKAFSETQP